MVRLIRLYNPLLYYELSRAINDWKFRCSNKKKVINNSNVLYTSKIKPVNYLDCLKSKNEVFYFVCIVTISKMYYSSLILFYF